MPHLGPIYGDRRTPAAPLPLCTRAGAGGTDCTAGPAGRARGLEGSVCLASWAAAPGSSLPPWWRVPAGDGRSDGY